MNHSPFPRLLDEFPAVSCIPNVGFQSVLLRLWKPGGQRADGCQTIKCLLCPPGEGFAYAYRLREWQLFRHIQQDHFDWWQNLGWGVMKCPHTYSEWVSMVDMENWENVCRLHEGFDSDSDLSPPRQMSPLWQPFENEGTFSDMRSRGPSEEY